MNNPRVICTFTTSKLVTHDGIKFFVIADSRNQFELYGLHHEMARKIDELQKELKLANLRADALESHIDDVYDQLR